MLGRANGRNRPATYTASVPVRGVWTFVIMFWLAGPLAGGGCLRACPDPTAASTSADTCHASAPGSILSGTHDCGTHFAPTRDVVSSTARKDVAPVTSVHVTAFASETAEHVSEWSALLDSSPPIRFLTPLRQ